MHKTLITLVLGTRIIVAAQTAQTKTLTDHAKPYLDAALAAGQSFVVVSAASGMPNLAADALATVFGQNLASQTATGTAPYQPNLGGVSLQVVDSAGAVRVALLLYVSPGQINFLVPAGTAAGTATVNVLNGTQNPPTGTFQVQTVAPALFTANENGEGVVSATAYRITIPINVAFPIPVYECLDVPGTCRSVPIDPGIDAPVFVTVNATGLRGRSGDSAVQLTIGGQPVAIQAINALDDNGASPGIDQLFFGLPPSPQNLGEVDLVVKVDGTTSNTARINIM